MKDFLFSFITPLFQLAESKIIQEDDTPSLPKKCYSKSNGELLLAAWDTRNRGLAGALCKIYFFEYSSAGVYLFLNCCLSFAGPVLLGNLVTCAERGDSIVRIAANIALLFSSRVVMAIFSTQYSFYIGHVSIAITAAIKMCIFKKILRLSTDSRRKYTAGNISNLYTVDIERVVNVGIALHNFWALPLQICIAMVETKLKSLIIKLSNPKNNNIRFYSMV